MSENKKKRSLAYFIGGLLAYAIMFGSVAIVLAIVARVIMWILGV